MGWLTRERGSLVEEGKKNSCCCCLRRKDNNNQLSRKHLNNEISIVSLLFLWTQPAAVRGLHLKRCLAVGGSRNDV